MYQPFIPVACTEISPGSSRLLGLGAEFFLQYGDFKFTEEDNVKRAWGLGNRSSRGAGLGGRSQGRSYPRDSREKQLGWRRTKLGCGQKWERARRNLSVAALYTLLPVPIPVPCPRSWSTMPLEASISAG